MKWKEDWEGKAGYSCAKEVCLKIKKPAYIDILSRRNSPISARMEGNAKNCRTYKLALFVVYTNC